MPIIKLQLKDGNSIQVRLDPPSLGTVRIDLSLRDGALYARLVAESPQVNQLLREKSQDLQRTLRMLGLSVDQVNVSIGSGSEQFSGSTFSQQSDQSSNEQDVSNGNFLFGEVESGVTETPQVAEPLDHWVA